MQIDEALKDVQLIRRLAEEARMSVRGGAPFFVIWGAVWVVGYLLPWLGVAGGAVGPVWIGLDLAGGVASWWVGASPLWRARRGGARTRMPYLVQQWFWSAVILFAAVAGTVAFSLHGRALGLAPQWTVPLVVGAWYALGGVMFRSRLFLLLGLWIGLLSVVLPALTAAPAIQQAAMGVLGGGAMLASGLGLLRTAHRG